MNLKGTKLGISVAFLSMLCFFAGYVDFTACAVLFFLCLAFSDSIVAKRNASQAIALSVFFKLFELILTKLGEGFNQFLEYITGWFDGFYKISSVLSKLNVANFLATLINVVFLVMMVIFVFIAASGKQVNVPIISKFVNKHIPDDEENEE